MVVTAVSCVILMNEQITLLSGEEQLVQSGLERVSAPRHRQRSVVSGQVFPPHLIPSNQGLFALITFDINDAFRVHQLGGIRV